MVIALAVAAYFMLARHDDGSSKVLTEKVIRGDFIHDVVESGEVESSENVEIRCDVKSRNGAGTTIITVVPEGAFVQGPHKNDEGKDVPGELLVQLDSSSMELEYQQEEIILNNKKAARDQAGNLLNAAESALREYVGLTEYAAIMRQKKGDNDPRSSPPSPPSPSDAADGDDIASDEDNNGSFHVEQNLVEAEKFVAEENKRKAQQYWRYSLSLAKKGYVTQQQLASDHFALLKAEKDLEAAKIKLSVLQVHTKQKLVSQLLSDINNAEAVFLAEENSVKVQEDRVEEIKDQIEKCTIYAPQDGIVVYANQRDRRGNADFLVEPGAVVRERQVIVRLPNSDKMQVRAKISESKISMLDSDQPLKATVTIDAFGGMKLDGLVTKVNDYPEPSSWFSATVKEYVALVQILNPPPSLKSGLTAKISIHAERLPNVLQVPIQSVHRHQGRYYCFVKEQLGWRVQPVTLGPSNDKQVVIEDGLSEGQVVALDPGNLLELVTLPDVPKPGRDRGSRTPVNLSTSQPRSIRQ